MNKTPKIWEIFAAFIPVIAGIVIWLWNLSITVSNQGKDIEYLKTSQSEYKADVKEMKKTLDMILIKMENKQDRK